MGTIFFQESIGNTCQVPAPLSKGAAVVLKALATSLAMTPHTGGVSPDGFGIRPCVATGLASVA